MDQTFLLHLKPWEQRLSYQIAQGLPAEKVFILATSLFIEHTESIFSPSRIITRDDEQVYVLVLLPAPSAQPLAAIAALLQKTCDRPVLPLVQSLADFNRGLSEGDFFCCYVLKNARLIHDGGAAFPAPAAVDGTALHGQLESLYRKALRQDGRLMKKAAAAGDEAAIALLKEAVLHALQTMLLMGVGLALPEAGIRESLEYCGMVSPEPATVFPRHTNEDRRRLALLDQSPRKSNPADRSWLAEKAKALRKVLEKWGAARLAAIATPGKPE